MPPIIGITPSPIRDQQSHGTFDRYALSVNYVNAVIAAGGMPIILPPQDGDVLPLLDLVDGLLFSGGADIDPASTGMDVHPTTYHVSPLRDRFEMALMRAALERDMPVLCICRGIQLLNVALGGTLIQHIPDHVETELAHRQQELGIQPPNRAMSSRLPLPHRSPRSTAQPRSRPTRFTISRSRRRPRV